MLWQEEWQRRFEKEMDLSFILHSGSHWPNTLFEPFTVGISFPMLNREQGPWLVRQQREEVDTLGRALSEMSRSCHIQVGNHLHKLWLSTPAGLSHPVRVHGALIASFLMTWTLSKQPSPGISMAPSWQKLKTKFVFRRPDPVIISALPSSVPIERVRIFGDGTPNVEMLKMKHLKRSVLV